MYRGRLEIVKTSLVDEKLTEDQLHDNTCMICLDIVMFPVSCTVCRSKYCMPCANIWKAKHNSCPKKCQEPWLLNIDKSSGILLRCPYDKECPHSTPETLNSHLAVCKSAPQHIKRNFYLRDNYLCEKEHLLEFWLSTFQDMINTTCFECRQETNSRAVCHKCKVKYCVNCRPPPCTKSKCPNGHAYIKNQHTPHLTYVCDICGLEAGPIFQDIYDDVKCNFGVCGNCIQGLPEEQSIKASENNYEECRKGHPLRFLPTTQQGVCCHCEFNRELDRICETCQVRYCLECKPMKIRINNTCPRKHQFRMLEAEGPAGVVCRRCKQPQVMVVDQQCHVFLCQDCYFGMRLDADNLARLIGQYCSSPQKHALIETKRKEVCSDCKRQAYCWLRCGPCDANFCMRCRPSKHHPKQDYLGHPYEASLKTDPFACMSCGAEADKRMECDLCLIEICLQCYDKL